MLCYAFPMPPRKRAAKPATKPETAPVQEDTVTDTDTTTEIQGETTEGQAEAGTVDGGHTFNQGDTASVIRGKLRGRKGTILKHNPTAETYAVELEDGTLAVVNAKNLKAPQDSTVSVSALVSALASFGAEAGSSDEDAAIRLANALDATVPGVSVKLHEALAAR
jgi:hypothetical protein